jgi:hypothetical protein
MKGVIASPAIRLRRRSTTKALALDPARELGAGGEARVMAVPGDDSLVAKLYHEPTLAKARKVAVMMADEPALDAASASLAWPLDLLTDERSRFVGFLMERAAGPRVFELYNPSTRRHAAPRGDYALLHRVGANVAAACEALHARGYVIGDVNESNVLVRPGGAVTLVDTDSMQVPDPANGTVLRSRVGKAEFTPPELQGRPFADFDRSPEHDRFGLAVLLFLLLMEGTHPFAGRLEDGREMPPIEERIRRGLFPHDDHAEIRPPKLAPDFSLLDPGLRALFVRCFEDGHANPSARPTAAEWRAALVAAWAELRKCGKNRYHRFGAHLASCPWCERAALLGGRDPFPGKAPPLERKPRGSNRKGAVVLRSAAATAKKAAPAPAAPAARKTAAPAPAPAPPARGPWLPAVSVPPWLAPVLGPSGVQHPASWIAPALTLIFLAPTGIMLLCLVALVAAASWWLWARPQGRANRHTFDASAAMQLMAIVFVVFTHGLAPALPSPEPLPPGTSGPVFEPTPTPAAPTAWLEFDATPSYVDSRPELLNLAEVERAVTDAFARSDMPAGWEAIVAVLVKPDGEAVPGSVTVVDPPDASVTTEAALALGSMRFRPLTRDGAPATVMVRMRVRYDYRVIYY